MQEGSGGCPIATVGRLALRPSSDPQLTGVGCPGWPERGGLDCSEACTVTDNLCPFIESDLRDLALRRSGSRLLHGAIARIDEETVWLNRTL
jgi:hypothetical protein